jgi:hypothetical protein
MWYAYRRSLDRFNLFIAVLCEGILGDKEMGTPAQQSSRGDKLSPVTAAGKTTL